MRIISKSRKHFLGTHKGAEIDIEREDDGTFYIRVRARLGEGGHLYDGYAPASVSTMREAKREAIRGAMLDATRYRVIGDKMPARTVILD
jgi:hypothetical protein